MTQIINISAFVLSLIIPFFIYKLIVARNKGSNIRTRKMQKKIERFSGERGGSKSFTQVSAFAADSGSDLPKLTFSDHLKKIMKNAGIAEIGISYFIIACVVGGCISAAAVVYFDLLEVNIGIPVGLFAGVYLVYGVFSYISSAKKEKFLAQFPDVIDMMNRYVQVGLTIGHTIKLISMEAKDPIAAEYKIISQKLDLGANHEKALLEAANRIDIEEFRLLVVALILQIQTGGILSETLQNIADIIRKRAELDLKIKAMSAEAKVSAIIISVLPFAFAGIMSVVQPNHLKGFSSPGGHTLLKVAFALLALGTFSMFKIAKMKV